ncbi:hypothetical protein BCV69DRAFT_244201 [Microstroma glucosiphilum]|uniref:MOSC domain-containing protein n=1 Tax=Pseudomicrostroma glucosiphilum TaxID=1684307 RepID=A0A316UJ84_9BASI|nr:hypothetical protein BCV69DRAFT_244201 [Pseudomicrostroma glucosiphilum]PWN24003.1 hypothetical protein BCV69DRAFT_244201 [Pseudomicrostroma glucosiphilum]
MFAGSDRGLDGRPLADAYSAGRPPAGFGASPGSSLSGTGSSYSSRGSSSRGPPWQRVVDRFQCLRDDPDCRNGVILHAGLMLLIIILACSRKILVASPPAAKDAKTSSGSSSSSKSSRKVSKAKVHSLIVYPIKSCAGVELQEAHIGRKGLELDRRWMIVRRGKVAAGEQGKWDKMSLREEPKLTLIQPGIESDHLSLSISSLARSDLQPIKIPLDVNQSWATLPAIEMWGDTAGGRIVQCLDPSASLSPSSWLSSFLGYPVHLIQFDPQGPKRDAFPFYRRPDLVDETGSEMDELRKPRGIEFQDEYPLLIASIESLQALQEQIRDAVLASDETTDGRGGPRVGGKLFKAENWKEKVTSADEKTAAPWLSMLRFRPNIVITGGSASGTSSIEPWEEDKWTMLEIDTFATTSSSANDSKPPTQSSSSAVPLQLHLSAHCERCLLTAVDPITAERDVSIPLAFLRRSRNEVKVHPLGPDGLPLGKASIVAGKEGKKGPCFGVYGVPAAPEEKAGAAKGQGLVRVGDEVRCYWRSNDGMGD